MNKDIDKSQQDNGLRPIMTVREVSAYLRLAESTVYKLAQTGQLPGRKIGGTWRFSKEGLEAWLREPPGLAEPPAAS